MLSWKHIAFTDAGFGALPWNRSIESHVVIFGDVLEMGGAIHRRGALLGSRCAKIRRVGRSTLSEGARADVTASDVALWTQILLTAISAWKYDYTRPAPPNDFPISGPLNKAPTNQEARQETKYGRLIALSTMPHSDKPSFVRTLEFSQGRCCNCDVSFHASTSCVTEVGNSSHSQRKPSGISRGYCIVRLREPTDVAYIVRRSDFSQRRLNDAPESR